MIICSFPLMNEETYTKKYLMKKIYENDTITKAKWMLLGLPIFIGDTIKKKI